MLAIINIAAALIVISVLVMTLVWLWSYFLKQWRGE
jgi:hypothetical protein